MKVSDANTSMARIDAEIAAIKSILKTQWWLLTVMIALVAIIGLERLAH